ncbi:MAG: MBL fold metallo-hydrolase [Patescibacteria group bacterium]
MQIKYRGGQKFEIKSKELEINLGQEVSINGFVFPGPGEYEKGGVILNGITDGENTIYAMVVEDMKICYLGRINHDLTEDELKQIGDVDILFTPLGEEGTADLKIATKLISKIDPKMVVPMLYSDLTEFKKIENISDEEIDILKIKKSELPEDERKIVVLRTTS